MIIVWRQYLFQRDGMVQTQSGYEAKGRVSGLWRRMYRPFAKVHPECVASIGKAANSPPVSFSSQEFLHPFPDTSPFGKKP